MVLHCIRSQASSIVVASHGTDIPVLLLAHFSKMSCPKIWMKSCTSKKHRYIPIHLVTAKFDNCVLSILPAFHSLTGSDTIHKFILSFLAGHTKKSCWNIFIEHYNLLQPSAKVFSVNTHLLMQKTSYARSTKLQLFLLTVIDQTFLLKVIRWRCYPNARCPILSRQAGTLANISVESPTG